MYIIIFVSIYKAFMVTVVFVQLCTPYKGFSNTGFVPQIIKWGT